MIYQHTPSQLRALFEQVVALPPYERSIQRNDERSGWAGAYTDHSVHLAWDVMLEVVQELKRRGILNEQINVST